MKKKSSAFSLIELLVTVAIIGILAAAATVAYGRYTLKANIANMIQTAASYQLDVDAYYIRYGNLTNYPLVNDAPANPIILSIAVDDTGNITVTGTPAVQNVVLILRPAATANGLQWTNAVANASMLPLVPISFQHL